MFSSHALKKSNVVSPVDPLLDCNGILHDVAVETSEILQKHYRPVFSDPADIYARNLNKLTPSQYTITGIRVTVTGIITSTD